LVQYSSNNKINLHKKLVVNLRLALSALEKQALWVNQILNLNLPRQKLLELAMAQDLLVEFHLQVATFQPK
jgi:hypothetical protein